VARAVLILVFLFLALLAARWLRMLAARLHQSLTARRRPPPRVAAMARDPICGAWFDRSLGVAARQGGRPIEVCSEACRRKLEAS
jgi:hypothetical protein